jgi:hypothetical protein
LNLINRLIINKTITVQIIEPATVIIRYDDCIKGIAGIPEMLISEYNIAATKNVMSEFSPAG